MTNRFLRKSSVFIMLAIMAITLSGCSEALDGALKFVKNVVSTVKDVFTKISSTVKTVKDAVKTGKETVDTVKDLTSGKNSAGSGSKKGEGMPPPDDETDDSRVTSPKDTATKTSTGTGSRTGVPETEAEPGSASDLQGKIASSRKNIGEKINDLRNLLNTDLPPGAKLEIEKALSGMEFLDNLLSGLAVDSSNAQTVSELERVKGQFADCEKYFNGLVASAKAAVATIEKVAEGAEKAVDTVRKWVDRLSGAETTGSKPDPASDSSPGPGDFAGNDPEIQRIFREELTSKINEFHEVSIEFNRAENDLWDGLGTLDREMLTKSKVFLEDLKFFGTSGLQTTLIKEINDFYESIRNKPMSKEILKKVQEFRDKMNSKIDSGVAEYREFRQNGLEAAKTRSEQEKSLLPQLSSEAREAREALAESLARLFDDRWSLEGSSISDPNRFPDGWKKAGFGEECLSKISAIRRKANEAFEAREAVFKELSKGPLSSQDIERAKRETREIDDLRSELYKEHRAAVAEGIREMGIKEEAAIEEISTAIFNKDFAKAAELTKARR